VKEEKEDLKLMSFNVRYDNPADGKCAWKYRKDPAVKALLNELPQIIGVQEAEKHQREQLREGLNDYYEYYGAARDLHVGEECGIFYQRHRFTVHG
jgi:endonuclease/exonuclease/phosphatase family metal-dependent hydrolase